MSIQHQETEPPQVDQIFKAKSKDKNKKRERSASRNQLK